MFKKSVAPLPALIFSTLLFATVATAQSVIATVATDRTPQAIAVNPVTNMIYVGNTGAADVTVINGATLQTTSVGAGNSPVAIAVNSVSNTIYVVNLADNTVTVINGNSNGTSTVNVGQMPNAIAANSATGNTYVVNSCGTDPSCASPGTVTVINGNNMQTVTVGATPLAVAVNATTNKIYVVNNCGNDPSCGSPGTVTVIDGATNNTSTVTVGVSPDGIALDPVTNQIYVANACGNDPINCASGGTVTVIDGSNPSNTATVTVGNSPGPLAVNSVTNNIYVTNQADNTVSVINGANNTVTATLNTGSAARAIAVDSSNNTIYTANTVRGTSTLIDGATNATYQIGVGRGPAGVAVNPVTNLAFVSNTISNTVSVIIAPLQFVAVPPCRLVDTRGGSGPIQGGTSHTFSILQLPCGIPASALAYSLNVTVVPQGPLGFLTIWPTGQSQPVVSTMNSLDGRTKANAAIVLGGTSGAVDVFVSNTANVILDIDGYFELPTTGTLDFYPLPPCRVIDTRGSNNDLGGPFLKGQQERDFPVLESSCIPPHANPQAYSFNVTAVPHTTGTALGYLTIWPQGESQPTVSTLNNPTATDVANAAIVPAGASGGGVAVFPSNDTDLVIDINGYFAPPSETGLQAYVLTPCRVLDTRSVGNGQPFMGPMAVNVAASACASPASAQAYVFNATVVPAAALGYLSLWPDGENQPVVSTLNALDGLVTSNMAIVPTMNGSIDAFASNLTQLVLDISSYFAP